ncbi:FGGY family carbohydrate kinase [Rhizobium sp. TRM96647]|uniref:FGGY-family carbohydrate kinase n=1 Tax=unclassified Rhizobium TaxID=2613769 RepID=UPI0021E71813|nr:MULTISPECIES: FGGY family carbohydrate kinase [unclassified Rhizobium]MCV3736117.1 FGGY family carbohydrate kinase [Rhizobium sp. TRM96647]MCV3758221.1 FGGY family carbohydrate kinase [Rhizobium sp. TRM96650]
MSADASTASVAVLDIGKTNIKLSAVTRDGVVAETLSVTNAVLSGPPWRHHDLAGTGDWVLDGLAALSRRHPIDTFVATGHGSGAVLVGPDPDDGGGVALPMIDYEQPLPEAIDRAYRPLAGSFRDRGSRIMHGATHQARQLLWMEIAEPERFARARWLLCSPQYWAFRLTGVAAAEATSLGAQSHLWNTPDSCAAPIVAVRGWQRLMPRFVPAWASLGTVRPALAARFGLPVGLRVLTGIHDSSANFYRYQAAGLADAAVVSTGTWIVGMSAATPLDSVREESGMTINSDVFGNPVAGALTMGGREFTHVAGETDSAAVDPALALRLVERGTMALPTFGADDGFFPGSAGRGEIVGPPPETAAERKALATLYMALLTVECLDALQAKDRAVLDGSYLREPLYARLVAAFRAGGETLFNLDAYGVATGTALLASHGTSRARDSLAQQRPDPFPGAAALLDAYRARWREAAHRHLSSSVSSRKA